MKQSEQHIEIPRNPFATQSNIDNGNGIKNNDTQPEPKESALETLAKNLETSGKYEEMTDAPKEMDMIAFKVFTPDFQKSDYVIGLAEKVIGEVIPGRHDYDLLIQILGKIYTTIPKRRFRYLCFCLYISSWRKLHRAFDWYNGNW